MKTWWQIYRQLGTITPPPKKSNKSLWFAVWTSLEDPMPGTKGAVPNDHIDIRI